MGGCVYNVLCGDGDVKCLMEFCGSEGTCRCSGVRVEGLGVKMDSNHWWNVFDIPDCEESKSH